ncbi:MAG: gliding motility-associated C-terminal domain-containing protein [Bacteroidota bacterium]
MKRHLIILVLPVILLSCEKEEVADPDSRITWYMDYRLGCNPGDTLYTFFMPNAFTPNSDGINDLFGPFGVGWKSDTYNLSIHDRNGSLVFQTDNPAQKWDGRMSGGSPVIMTGIFQCTVEVEECVTGKHHTYQGHITLVR